MASDSDIRRIAAESGQQSKLDELERAGGFANVRRAFERGEFERKPSGPQPIAGPSAADTAALVKEQRERSAEFLGRFTTGLPEAITGIETELGLPGLRETTQVAGRSARQVAGQVRDIPGTQRTIAKQVGISAPRLAMRTAAKTAELQPTLETAQRGLTEATAAQEFGEQAFATRLGQFITPFEVEAGLLGESVKEEFGLYKSSIKNALDLEVARLAGQTSISVAEINKATELAKLEQATLKGVLADLGDRAALINPFTKEEMASFTKGPAPAKLVGVGESPWE